MSACFIFCFWFGFGGGGLGWVVGSLLGGGIGVEVCTPSRLWLEGFGHERRGGMSLGWGVGCGIIQTIGPSATPPGVSGEMPMAA